MDYKQAYQLFRGWWQQARWNPWKAARALIGLGFLIILVAYLSAIGDQMGRPKVHRENVRSRQLADIEFENRWPFVRRVVLTKDQWNGYHFQIAIHNVSVDTTLRTNSVKLTALREFTDGVFRDWEDAVPVYLEWPSAAIPKEIPPQDRIYIPFARIYPPEYHKKYESHLSRMDDFAQLRFTVPLYGWQRVMRSHVPPGKHRFKLTVFFESAPSAEIELVSRIASSLTNLERVPCSNERKTL